jgi:hypothetical protein
MTEHERAVAPNTKFGRRERLDQGRPDRLTIEFSTANARPRDREVAGPWRERSDEAVKRYYR